MNLRDKLMSRAKGEVFGKEWCSPAEARLLLAALELAESAEYEDFDGGTTRRVTVNPQKASAFRAAKEALEQGAKDAE